MQDRSVLPAMPLELYLSIPAATITAAYHASLLLGILAPSRTLLILGQSIGLRLLFLPIAYLLLVILVEVYGLRIATLLTAVGMVIFAIVVLLIIFGYVLPATTNQPSLSGVNLPLVTLSVFMGYLIPTVISLWIVSFHRVEGSKKRFAARLFITPLVGSSLTYLLILIFYFGITSVPRTTMEMLGQRQPIHVLYCLFLVPLGYGIARLLQFYERRHMARVSKTVLGVAKNLRQELSKNPLILGVDRDTDL